MTNMERLTTRIALRTDTLENWTQNQSQILELGEFAIVKHPEGRDLIKIGDGVTPFSELKYLNEQGTDLTAGNIVAQSMTQGVDSHATPYGFAAGAFTSAVADFSQAIGFNSETSAGHDFAFVYNGDATRSIGNKYVSHGKGTFNINPQNGLSGFYIGDENLSQILSNVKPEDFTTSAQVSSIVEGYEYSRVYANGENIDLSIINTTAHDFYETVKAGNMLSNVVYIVSSDTVNCYGQRVVNVASPERMSDAATKGYVDDAIEQIDVSEQIQEVTQTLTAFYQRSETSSAQQIAQELEKYTIVNKVTREEYEDLKENDLVVDDQVYFITDDNEEEQKSLVLSADAEMFPIVIRRDDGQGETAHVQIRIPNIEDMFFESESALRWSAYFNDEPVVVGTEETGFMLESIDLIYDERDGTTLWRIRVQSKDNDSYSYTQEWDFDDDIMTFRLDGVTYTAYMEDTQQPFTFNGTWLLDWTDVIWNQVQILTNKSTRMSAGVGFTMGFISDGQFDPYPGDDNTILVNVDDQFVHIWGQSNFTIPDTDIVIEMLKLCMSDSPYMLIDYNIGGVPGRVDTRIPETIRYSDEFLATLPGQVPPENYMDFFMDTNQFPEIIIPGTEDVRLCFTFEQVGFDRYSKFDDIESRLNHLEDKCSPGSRVTIRTWSST